MTAKNHSLTMQKIIVIGCPGSGKSTFAKALCLKTGIPLFHLDMLYWNSDRTTVEKAVFIKRLKSVLNKEEWIIDGNYASTMEMRLAACNTVFFLDYPTEVCLKGILARRGKQRSDMPWTEDPNFEDAEFIRFVENYASQTRPAVLELLGRHPEKELHIFTSRSEGEEFLSKL